MSNTGKVKKIKGIPVQGLDRVRGDLLALPTRLTEKDRENIAKLFKAGHNRGFVDNTDENGDYRIVWEFNLKKDR